MEEKQLSSSSRKELGAASIGNFGEIFDFAVFAFSVPILSVHFFPGSDPTAALLNTFAVYAVALFARPMGGLFFGYLADRIGRVRVLTLTIWLIAASTALIGLLPTHESIGVYAPILLVICRVGQGLAIGGETTSSTSYILEAAPDGHRGRWVGIIWFWAMVPNAVVALLLLVLKLAVGEAAYSDWVWRVPFLLGGLIGVVGFWLRRNLEEPAEFTEAKKQAATGDPLAAVSRSGLRSMLYVACIQPTQTVGAYLLAGFMYSFLVREAGLSSTAALLCNAIGILALAFTIPLSGRLSDRFGRKRLLTVGAIWITLTAYPCVSLAGSGSLTAVIFGQVLFAVGVGLYSGATFPAVAELFPTSFRATGHAISYQLLVAIFGGTTPFIATWLIRATGDVASPAYYVTFMGLLGLALVQLIPETNNVNLRTAVGSTSQKVPKVVQQAAS
ncbi:MFS transporter [Rhizobium leguminosarum]|uniref:MFS transporter n=1 Tax=Rhizobium leguminosarum TaxID=384 RepID=UPI0024B39C7B|nr:MFS transporter [Rhizobium leguminosarum]WHO82623.1 MFS transporter [Rhizobium leguminosarum]